MTDTDVTFLQYYRSCPYIRHDLYLPPIPASLQTLGRVECAVANEGGWQWRRRQEGGRGEERERERERRKERSLLTIK